MENQLARIGMLIFDLRAGVEVLAEKEKSDFLKKEFERITIALGYKWFKKVPGYPYLVEFHRLEAGRLMETVIEMENFQIELAESGIENEFLQDLHTELIVHLSELIDNIDKMVSTPGPFAGPSDLN